MRVALLALALLSLDQISKWLAQQLLDGREFLFAPDWGLTYVINPGLWIWPEVSPPALYLLHGLSAVLFVSMVLARRWYGHWYRPSMLIDLALAFLAVAAFGNGLDRLQVGGARDWVITPLATGNVADVAELGTIGLLAAEMIAYPPARRLLSIDPRRWRPPTPNSRETGGSRQPTARVEQLEEAT